MAIVGKGQGKKLTEEPGSKLTNTFQFPRDLEEMLPAEKSPEGYKLSGRYLKITELYGSSARLENEHYITVELAVTGKRTGTEAWGEHQISLNLTVAAAREFADYLINLANTAEKIPGMAESST